MAETQKKNFYHWMLNLPESITSPDHYELLGLVRFTDDEKAIRDAAIDANGKLLAWQNSQYHQECDHLLDEMVAAQEILLDEKLRIEYDRQLRQRLGVDDSLEEARDGKSSVLRRPWECPGCSRSFRIPADAEEPTFCPDCSVSVLFDDTLSPGESDAVQATQPVTDGTEDRWHYEIMGQKFGPSPISELIRSARDGFLTRDTLVRQGTQSDWVSADRCPQLADVFGRQEAESDDALTDWSDSSSAWVILDDEADESNAELNDLERRIRETEKRLVEVDADMLQAVQSQLRELYAERNRALECMDRETRAKSKRRSTGVPDEKPTEWPALDDGGELGCGAQSLTPARLSSGNSSESRSRLGTVLNFQYEGVNASGNEKSGVIEATSEAEAHTFLRDQGILVSMLISVPASADAMEVPASTVSTLSSAQTPIILAIVAAVFVWIFWLEEAVIPPESTPGETTFQADPNLSSSGISTSVASTTKASLNEGSKWYTGGTLHEATMREWKRASYSNRLATCADFVAGTLVDSGKPYPGQEKLKPLAQALERGISEAGQDEWADNQNVSTIAAALLLSIAYQ